MATTNIAIDDDLLSEIDRVADLRGEMKGSGTTVTERVTEILTDYIRGAKTPSTSNGVDIQRKRIKRTANRL